MCWLWSQTMLRSLSLCKSFCFTVCFFQFHWTLCCSRSCQVRSSCDGCPRKKQTSKRAGILHQRLFLCINASTAVLSNDPTKSSRRCHVCTWNLNMPWTTFFYWCCSSFWFIILTSVPFLFLWWFEAIFRRAIQNPYISHLVLVYCQIQEAEPCTFWWELVFIEKNLKNYVMGSWRSEFNFVQLR